MDGLNMSNHRLINEKSAYTLFEILVVLLLIGIVSGGVSSIFSSKQTNYEILAEAHNIKSTIRLLQAKAMQFFEQKLYANTEMRDDDLWGIQILRGNTLKLVSKSYNSQRIEQFELKGPVWTDSNIYSSHNKTISYKLTNPCLINEEVFFDALGKPVNREGDQCDKDIHIQVSASDTNKTASIIINRTGRVTIQRD